MRILAATDGSRGGNAALKFAALLAARDPASELVVLTVGMPSPGPGHAVEVPESADGQRRFAQKILESAAQQMRGRRVRVRYRYVSVRRGAPVPEAISREADRLRADLVVVGSEGRDTLREWVVGGVALRLIYVARRPVAVVRPPRRRNPA